MLIWRNKQRGDTIIEVMLAIVIFSSVAVMTLTLMNNSAASAQRSLELSLVREQIDTQAQLLRSMHNVYIKKISRGESTSDTNWQQIPKKDGDATSFDSIITSGETGAQCNYPAVASKPFIVDSSNLGGAGAIVNLSNIQSPETFAKVEDNIAKGLWVEAVKGKGVSSVSKGKKAPDYVDFHIKACWNSVGQSQPMTLGTIVRLYEPVS